MEDKKILKKALGILIHLSEHRGKNKDKKKTDKNKYYQKKSEELKKILILHWEDSKGLKINLDKFQRSLKNN